MKIFAYFSFVIIATGLAWLSITTAVIFLCVVVLCAIHGKADSLIEISFGPLKAKLERKVSEAEELLQTLRKLALVQARSAIAASAHTGRFATGNDWIFQNMRRVEASLISVGASEEDLREARQDLVKLTLRDLAHAALGGSRVPSQLGEIAIQEWKALIRSEDLSSPEAVENWLNKWGALNDERAQRIEDMRWIAKNQTIRDSDQYLRAHNSVDWQ